MSDDEISSMVGAVRELLDTRDVNLRAQLADLRSQVDKKSTGSGLTAAMAGPIADALIGYVQRCLAPMQERIAELERTPLRYDGPFEGEKTYQRGTFVTHGGSLWHCNHETTDRPGDTPAWVLAVKRGKDAR
jgi:hypothetical protein